MENIFNKIENKFDLKKLVKKIFIIFMIIQPILDVYMTLFDSKIQIVGISLATIIRFGIVFIMTLMIMIHARKNKSTKIFIGYMILVVVYTIFHHINASTFSIELPTVKYSFLSEILYLARMCIPVALIYIIYNIKLNYKDIKKIVLSVSLIISAVVIITNLLKVAYMSYSLEDVVIKENMISWLGNGKYDYYWKDLTCRGWFQSGNQLSGVTVILVPVITYIALREKKIRNWIVLILHLITMLNLTTRVGVFGGIVFVVGISFIYVLEKMIHKEISLQVFKQKNIYCFLVTVMIFAVMYMNSPFRARASEGEIGYDIGITTNTEDNTKPEEIKEEEIDKAKFIEENLDSANINYYYIYQAYPYTQDLDFWYDMIAKVPEYERAGNRKMRTLLIERILEKDNRMSNYIWGISFVRSSSFIWPERDFETQVDSLGIVGTVLFIGPYIAVVLLGVWKFFKNFKDNLYLSKVVYLIAIVAGLFAAYVAGHILNEVFPFVFLAMMAGIALNIAMGNNPEIYETKKELRKYFEKVYSEGKDAFYKELENSLRKEEKRFIVTANPETLMIAESNSELKECLLEKYVTIVPDGIGIIKGAKILGYPQKETITGVELAEQLFKYCDEQEKTIYLFGAKQEVIEKLENVINEKYPKAKIVGKENGYVEDKQKAFEEIKKLSPDLILVALGIPKQEILINNNYNDFKKGIFIGVGGSFDVLSGTKKRAPKFFRKLHLEWLYRIMKEPKRLKRFFDSNIKYIFKLSEEK